MDTGYEAAEKGSANTDTKDDAEYNDEEDDLPIGGVPFGMKQQGERRLADFNTATVMGKLNTRYKAAEKRSPNTDTKDDTEYDDKEDDPPVGGVPFGMKQQGERHLADFNTATVVAETSVDPIIDLLSLIVSRTFQLISIHSIIFVGINCYN